MITVMQGDHGTVVNFTVRDESGIVNLSTATSVVVRLMLGSGAVDKVCAITDALNGACQMTLTEAETATAGTFPFQGTVHFSGSSKFSGEIDKLKILPKL